MLGAGERAADLVATCVESFSNTAWPAVAWTFSDLSVDGCPLQFEFSSNDDRLRYVTEVAPPEEEHHARLGAAAELIERLGLSPPPEREIRFWELFQAGRLLRFGAWAGIRCNGTSASAKLYVEVSPELRDPAAAGIAQPIVPSSRIMMAGYDCASGVHEYYFRQPQMDSIERLAFLRFVAGADGRQRVLDALCELSALPVRAALDWLNFGYSLTRGLGGEERFSMFLTPRSLRSAARIRRDFLRWEERGGRTASPYRDLVGPLPDVCVPQHGIVSVNTDAAGRPELRVAVSAAALNLIETLRCYATGSEESGGAPKVAV